MSFVTETSYIRYKLYHTKAILSRGKHKKDKSFIGLGGKYGGELGADEMFTEVFLTNHGDSGILTNDNR